jgi:hypothetical protein
LNVEANFLQINTADVVVPAALSNSTFLKDISAIPGNNDLVGSPATTSSLGLAKSYTTFLFTFCGTSCSGKFGFHFDPLTDLKLDTTSLQGSFPSSFTKTISEYASVAWFLDIAYLLAFLFNLFTIILSCLNSPVITAVTSGLTTLFLLAASGAGLGVFMKVKGSFNSALSHSGIQTDLGKQLFILSWIATTTSLLASIISCIHSCRSKPQRRRGGKSFLDTGGMQDPATMPLPRKSSIPGFLKKVPTWRRHQYAQIDERQERPFKNKAAYDTADSEILLTRGFGGGELEEEEERELPRGSMRGIQMQPMGNSSRDASTAYEPFREL